MENPFSFIFQLTPPPVSNSIQKSTLNFQLCQNLSKLNQKRCVQTKSNSQNNSFHDSYESSLDTSKLIQDGVSQLLIENQMEKKENNASGTLNLKKHPQIPLKEQKQQKHVKQEKQASLAANTKKGELVVELPSLEVSRVIIYSEKVMEEMESIIIGSKKSLEEEISHFKEASFDESLHINIKQALRSSQANHIKYDDLIQRFLIVEDLVQKLQANALNQKVGQRTLTINKKLLETQLTTSNLSKSSKSKQSSQENQKIKKKKVNSSSSSKFKIDSKATTLRNSYQSVKSVSRDSRSQSKTKAESKKKSLLKTRPSLEINSHLNTINNLNIKEFQKKIKSKKMTMRL